MTRGAWSVSTAGQTPFPLGTLYGCIYRVGHVEPLAGDRFDAGSAWAPKPAVAIAGPLVAFSGSFETGTGVSIGLFIATLVEPPPGGAFVATFPVREGTGSVVLRPNGSVAWITCNLRRLSRVAPPCPKPGRTFTQLEIHEAGRDRPGASRTLDTGNRIAPNSLHLHGDRVTWIKAGKKRHATLR